MKRAILAVTAILLASCTDSNIVSPPELSRRSASDGSSLYVYGQTIGPDGSLWQTAGEYQLCRSTTVEIIWSGVIHTSRMDVKCAPSVFSSPDSKTYEGGIASVLVQSDNGWTSLGWVSGDMSQQGSTFSIPTGAAVRLQASLNPGCELSFWKTDIGNFTNNPLDVPAGSVIGFVEANFYCWT